MTRLGSTNKVVQPKKKKKERKKNGGREKQTQPVRFPSNYQCCVHVAKFTALLCSNTLLPAGETALYGSATFLRTIGVLLRRIVKTHPNSPVASELCRNNPE